MKIWSKVVKKRIGFDFKNTFGFGCFWWCDDFGLLIPIWPNVRIWTFDTHMNHSPTYSSDRTNRQRRWSEGQLIFSKQNKKYFLWQWDIGIRMNLQILNFWRVWENFEGGLDNIVRWYDGTGNMFRDDPENMLSRDFYDFNQVWRIQTPISSAICKKIKKNRRPSQYVFILQLEFLQFIIDLETFKVCFLSGEICKTKNISSIW